MLTDTSRAYIESMKSAVGNLDHMSRSVTAASSHFAELDKKISSARVAVEKISWAAKNHPIQSLFQKIPKEVYESRNALVAYNKELEKATFIAKAFELRMSMSFSSPLKNLNDLTKGLSTLHSTVTTGVMSGFRSFTDILKASGGSLKNIRDATIEYNRSVYDASRLSEIIGRKNAINSQNLMALTKNTNLSKQGFVSLYNQFMIMNKGVAMTLPQFSKFTEMLTRQFGGGLDQIKDKMQIFNQLQQDIPDLMSVINRMNREIAAGVDPKGMREYLSLAQQLQGNRGSDFLALMTTKVGEQTQAYMELENQIAKYQVALDNLSVNTGLKAENSMVSIAKNLEAMTEQVDNFVGSTKGIASAIALFGPIAMVTGSMLSLGKAATTAMNLLGIATAKTTGMRLPTSLKGKAAIAAVVGTGIYGAYKYFKPKMSSGELGEAGGSGADIDRKKRQEAREISRKQEAAQKDLDKMTEASKKENEKQEKIAGTHQYLQKQYTSAQTNVKLIVDLTTKWADASSSVAEKLKEIGMTGSSIIGASQQSSEAARMTYEQYEKLYQTAKNYYNVAKQTVSEAQRAAIEAKGTAEERTAAEKEQDANFQLARKSEALAVANAQRLLALQKSSEASMKSSTIEQEATAGLLERQRGLLSSQADYQEKLALGMATSWAARKKVWEATVAERKELEKAAVNQRANMVNEKVLLREKDAQGKDQYKTLKEFGVTQSQINGMAEGHYSALLQAKAAIGDKDHNAINAATVLMQKYGMMVGMQKSIVDLKSQELEQTMKIREGYLDVINEMTTGNDLVSRLLPNMERGAMSLLDVRRQMTGADFGGAMRVGFGSRSGFGAGADAGNAFGYGPKGMRGGFSPVQGAYIAGQDAVWGTEFGWAAAGQRMGQSNAGTLGINGQTSIGGGDGRGAQSPPAAFGRYGNYGGGLLDSYKDGGLSGKSIVDLTATGGRVPGHSGGGKDNTFAQIGRFYEGGANALVNGSEYVVPPNMINGPEGLGLLEAFNKTRRPGSVSQGTYDESWRAASKNRIGVRIRNGSYIVNGEAANQPGASGALAAYSAGDPSRLQQMVGMSYGGGMLRRFEEGGIADSVTSNADTGAQGLSLGLYGYGLMKGARMGSRLPILSSAKKVQGALKALKEAKALHTLAKEALDVATSTASRLTTKAQMDALLFSEVKTAAQATEAAKNLKATMQVGRFAKLVKPGINALKGAAQVGAKNLAWGALISQAEGGLEGAYAGFTKGPEAVMDLIEGDSKEAVRKLRQSIGVRKERDIDEGWLKYSALTAWDQSAGRAWDLSSGVSLGLKTTGESLFGSIGSGFGIMKRMYTGEKDPKQQAADDALAEMSLQRITRHATNEKNARIKAFEESRRSAIEKQFKERRAGNIHDILHKNIDYQNQNQKTISMVGGNNKQYREKLSSAMSEQIKKQYPDMSEAERGQMTYSLVVEKLRMDANAKFARVRYLLAQSVEAKKRGSKGIVGGTMAQDASSALEDRAKHDLRLLHVPEGSVDDVVREMRSPMEAMQYSEGLGKVGSSLYRNGIKEANMVYRTLIQNTIQGKSRRVSDDPMVEKKVQQYESDIQGQVEKLIESYLLVSATSGSPDIQSAYYKKADDLRKRYRGLSGRYSDGLPPEDNLLYRNKRWGELSYRVAKDIEYGDEKDAFVRAGEMVADIAFKDSVRIGAELGSYEAVPKPRRRNQYRGSFSQENEEVLRTKLQYEAGQRKKRAYAPDLVTEGMMSGGTIGSLASGSSSSTNAVSKASLYLTGGINVDRLYLGGQLTGSRMKSDNSNFWKALEMQVSGLS